jgi:opacity protein-like surface antigen
MQQLRQIIRPFNVRIDPLIVFMIMAAIFIVAAAVSANATDPVRRNVPAQPNSGWMAPAPSWTGCGVQVHGGHSMGQANAGGPVGLSSTGLLPGASVLCDLSIGKSVVVGAFASGEYATGDYDTLGIRWGWDAGGRAGLLVGNALLYGAAAFTRINVTGLGDVDGWKWGPGVEFRFPDLGWSIDMRYQISDLESPVPGVDVEVRTLRIGLGYKFNLIK